MYAQAMKAGYTLPAKYGWFLAAWAWVCSRRYQPEPGMREISMEEWNATPTEYLVHPQLHPKLWGRVPEESYVENRREQLFKKHGYKDHNPSHPAEGGHGGHH